MTDRPHILALDHIASIQDPIRVTDNSGNPHLHYSAQHVKAAFLAGAASLPPATDPAMVTVPREDWDTAYRAFVGAFDTPLARRRHDDEYAADARRRLRDLDEALAAAPTIPVTGEAVPEGMKVWHGGDQEPDDWDEKADVLLSTGFQTKLKRGLLGYWAPDNGDILARVRFYTPKATIPATGHAATEGEG